MAVPIPSDGFIGWLAAFFGCVGLLMNCVFLFSAAPVLVEIRKTGSTGEYRYSPYLLNWANSFAWAIYCLHLGPSQSPFILICSIGGLTVTSLFLFFYAANITDTLVSRSFFRVVPLTFLFLTILAVRSFTLNDGLNGVAFEANWHWWKSICVLTNSLMFLGPMFALHEAWCRASADLVPLKFSLGSLLTASPWVCYAMCAGDGAVFLPNMLGVLLSLAQMLAHQVILAREHLNLENTNSEPLANGGPIISTAEPTKSAAADGNAAEMAVKTHVGRLQNALPFHGRQCDSGNDLVDDPWKQGFYTYGFLGAPQGSALAMLQLLRPGTEVELAEIAPPAAAATEEVAENAEDICFEELEELS